MEREAGIKNEHTKKLKRVVKNDKISNCFMVLLVNVLNICVHFGRMEKLTNNT